MNPESAKLINSKNPQDRKRFVSDLISTDAWKDNKATIDKLLRDPDAGVRETMANAVLEQDSANFMLQLRHIARAENEEIRAKALLSLSKTESINNIELFLNRMPYEQGEVTNALSANIVERLKDDQSKALEPILSALASADDSVSASALNMLTKAEDKSAAIRTFLEYVQSVSPSLRARIFEIIKKKKVIFATLAIQLLNDEKKPSVRLQALSLLKSFEDKELEEILLKEIVQEDWALKRSAMMMLGEMKSEKAKPVLIELLDDSEQMIDAVAALEQYQQADVAIIFIKRLAKAEERQQLLLLDAITAIANGNPKYIQPLTVFAGHQVSKEKAKLKTLRIVEDLCKVSGQEIPPQVAEIKAKIVEEKKSDLPDLGLKLSRD